MSDPWFKFYASDFLGGVASLSPAERGVYVTILALIYDNNGPVERRDARLARVCGCTVAAFKKSLDVLLDERKLVEVGGRLTNVRAESELKNRDNRTQNAKDAARERWDAEKKKTKQKQRKSDASASPEQCDGNAIPEARSQKLDIEEETYVSSPSPAHANDLSEACAIYNDAAERQGWPRMQKLNPERRKSLKARIRDAGGLDGWRIAIEKAEASDFICSRGQKGWSAFGFDALVSASKFTKIMEGTYDNRSNPGGMVGRSSTQGRGQSGSLASIAARRRAGASH